MIDIDPGYQKLCGTDALAYVRYRHGDNDLVRGARQQDFLRQVRSQEGIRKLLKDGYQPSNLKKLARIFARYFDSDKGLRQKQDLFSFAKTVLFTAKNPVREVKFRAVDAPDKVNLVASNEMLEETVSEFLDAKASATPREPTEPTAADVKASKERAKNRKNKPSSIAGLEEARAEGENQAIVAARKIDFPFYFPTLRTTTAAYQGQEPRTYKIRDEKRGKHDAYRLVLAKGIVGEYYGIQGTTWRQPPILDDPHDDGRPQRPQADGLPRRQAGAARRVADAARPSTGSPNTLTQSLSGQQMIGIAASLKRLGGG